ncbi:MAG: hypothetical protein QW273_02880, partial [Candidatus Pacearchaeota archaeon]
MKKASWMIEEIAKMILAVIGIVLLIFLIIKLIGIFINSHEYEQAKVMMKKIEELSKSEEGVKYFLYESPKKWSIIKIDDKTNKLCICPLNIEWYKKIFYKKESIKEDAKRKCVSEGVCTNLDKKVTMLNTICFDKIEDCFTIEKVPEMIILGVKKEEITFFPASYYKNLDEKTIELSRFCLELGFSGIIAKESELFLSQKNFQSIKGIQVLDEEIKVVPLEKKEIIKMKTKEVIIKNTGEVATKTKEGEKVIGVLAEGTKVRINGIKEGIIGKDIILFKGAKEEKVVALFGNSKVFQLVKKSIDKYLGPVGVVTTFGGTICDLYLLTKVGNEAFEAETQSIESGKIADE